MSSIPDGGHGRREEGELSHPYLMEVMVGGRVEN